MNQLSYETQEIKFIKEAVEKDRYLYQILFIRNIEYLLN